MKTLTLTALVALLLAAIVGCSSGAPDAFGAGGRGGGGSSTTGSTNTNTGSGGSTGTGSSCKPGGEPCKAFSECCSGTCANDICAACGESGQGCAAGCCAGLTCQNAVCAATCGAESAECQLAGDCCSNICSQGACAPAAPCGQSGAECVSSGQCCSAVCSNGKCVDAACAAQGFSCATPSDCCAGLSCQIGTCQPEAPCSATDTCAKWLDVGPPMYLYSGLCVTAKMNADALIGCFCMYCGGACTNEQACIDLWKTDQSIESGCMDCIQAMVDSTCLGYSQQCK